MSESERTGGPSAGFAPSMSSDDAAELEELRREAAALREQLETTLSAQGGLRSARDVHQLEARIDSLAARNSKLMETLKEARQQLLALREEVDRLGQPPSGYGVLLSVQDDETVDVFTSGRKMRLTGSPNIDTKELKQGQTALLVAACFLPDLEPIDDDNDDRPRKLRPGDSLLVDTKAGYAFERIPKAEVEDLVLEEVPDVTYNDIGGLGRQIEQIRDAVELPFLHKELYREYALRPPKGVLLYGPPGCGKTLIAKAVANSLAKKMAEVRGDDAREAKSYFLNIKGPELLNKFVGETE